MSEVDIKRPALTEEHSRGIGIVVLFLILAAHKQASKIIAVAFGRGFSETSRAQPRSRFTLEIALFHSMPNSMEFV